MDEPDERVLELADLLFNQARSGDLALLAAVDQGVPVELTNAAGDSLLMLAAYHGQTTMVRGLIHRGADVNRLNDRGQSPTAGAVFKGHDDVVLALTDAGADLDAGSPSARAAAMMFGRTLPHR